MNAGQDKTMIDIHERALNRIGDVLIELQDDTIKRMSDALEAAEARADELAAQLKAARAERDAALKQLTSIQRQLSEAFNSGDGAYRP